MSNLSCPISLIGEKLVKKLTRSELKRDAIVEAARAVFLAKGFDIASMDLIASEAGVSKRTVYSHFQSKENLFAHIMGEMCSSKRQEIIEGQNLESLNVFRTDRPLKETLTELGEALLHRIFDQEAISLLRILIGQSDKFPQIGRDYFNEGPKEMISAMSQYLKDMEELGHVKVTNHEMAAQMFLSSLLGIPHIECLLTDCAPPDKDRIQFMVSNVVEVFVNGISAKS